MHTIHVHATAVLVSLAGQLWDICVKEILR